MVQIVASIEYEAARPPDGLPDDMEPLPGVSLGYLAIKAIDSFIVHAALWQPENKPPAETTIIVQVHGSGGNLASLPLRVIARALSAQGYAALSISTRQHDEHVNTDNFFEVRRDIEAAIVTAKALGYRSIILQGHSLGTVQVAFFAAIDWDTAIKAVILTGAFGKLPWKSRHILIQDEEKYRVLASASRGALKVGTSAEILPINMRWIGGIETPITAQHFLTYRDEQASAADGTYWIPRIPRPILIVRDEADGVVLPFEPYMLLSAAQAEGSLVPSIKYVLVPDRRHRAGKATPSPTIQTRWPMPLRLLFVFAPLKKSPRRLAATAGDLFAHRLGRELSHPMPVDLAKDQRDAIAGAGRQDHRLAGSRRRRASASMPTVGTLVHHRPRFWPAIGQV